MPVTVTYNLPFESGTGKLYYAKLRNHYAYYDATNNDVRTNQSSKENTDNYRWSFSGNPYSGIKMKNEATGTYLDNTSSTVQLTEGGYAWTIKSLNGTATFGLFNGTNYINEQNTGKHNLIYWSQFTNDIGSQWNVEEVPDLAVTVTYNLVFGGEIVNTVVVEEVAVNSDVDVPSTLTSAYSTLCYDFPTYGTIGDTDCTITVTATPKTGLVKELSDLSNNKAYTLTTARGALYIKTDHLASNSNANAGAIAGKFAIISYEDNYYLYSSEESKFVESNGSLSETMTSSVVAVTLTPQSTNSLFLMKIGAYGVNVTNTNDDYELVIDSWTTADPGNQYAIIEVADFDPTAALAALEEYFHPSYTVTYKVQDEGGNILFTSEPVGTTPGASITTLPDEYKLTDFYSYNTIDITVSGTETEAVFTATLKEAPIFKFTADATSPVWHKLKMKDANYPTYVADGTPNVTLPTTDANNETVHWAFIGEPYAGFKIINRAAGTGLILGSASATNDGNNGGNTYVTLASPGSQTYEVFHAYHSGQLTNGFFLFNAEGYAMNQRSTDNLAYWTGGYDKGSTFVAEEVLEGEELFNTLIAQLEAIPFGTGLNQYKLFVEETDYTTQAATIISGLKSQGYSEENLLMAQMMLEGLTLNRPAAGFYRIKGKTSGKYLAAGLASNNKFNMSDATDATTIFYFDGTTLRNASTSLYNGMSTSAWAWVDEDAASTVVFFDGLTNGGYAIKSNDAYFYDNGDNSDSADRGGNLTINASTNGRYTNWYLEPASLPGDVNNDGSVTIADVTALVNIILGKDTENVYNHDAANVNGDESITIADVTALVNIILGKTN